MDTLVVGDLCMKQQYVLPRIDMLLEERRQIGRVVLLGNFVEMHEADQKILSIYEVLEDWVLKQRKRGLLIDVLMGEHDFIVLFERFAISAALPRRARREFHSRMRDVLGMHAATTVGPYLCSHAGVIEAWAAANLPSYAFDPEWTSTDLDEMLDSSERRFDLTGRRLDDDAYILVPNGPLSANLCELASYPLPDFPQIVGHTPVPTVADISKDLDEPSLHEIWACNTMSLTDTGTPIGDGSMLIVNDLGLAESIEFPGGDFADVAARYWRNR